MDILILAIWLIAAGFCGYFADKKGYNVFIALIVGIAIGLIGVLIYALLPDKKTTSSS